MGTVPRGRAESWKAPTPEIRLRDRLPPRPTPDPLNPRRRGGGGTIDAVNFTGG